jgi:hypothetical protein
MSTANLKDLQREDNLLAPIIQYLQNGTLPDDDKIARRLVIESADYVLQEGVLYHIYTPRGKGSPAQRAIRQLVVPHPLKKDILLSFHDSLMGGHFATERTYHTIRLRYYWTGMYKDVLEYCKSCSSCQRAKRDIHPVKPELQPMPIPGRVFGRLHVDIVGPITASPNGFKYVLVFVDAFSRWIEMIPIKECSAKTIAWHLYESIITRYGAPDELLSDRGQNFLANVVKELCSLFQITRLRTSSYHPMTNAATERMHQSIAQSIRALSQDSPLQWPQLLPGVAAALRMSPATQSTSFSPYFLLFKQEPRFPIDVALRQDHSLPPHTEGCLEEILKSADVTRQMAEENIKAAQKRYKDNYDQKAKTPLFELGQKVLLRCDHNVPGLSKKLQLRFQGPYYITKMLPNHVYVLRDCSSNKPLKAPVNACRLKPFHSRQKTEDNIRLSSDPPQHLVRQPAQSSEAAQPDTPTDKLPSISDSFDINQDDVFIVEKIEASKVVRGKQFYKIRWQGFSERTWEPAENIPGELKRQFHIRVSARPRRRAKR